MELLFIQGGSRWKTDGKSYYTETNFNDRIWKRYKKYCDHLVVLLRTEEKLYTEEEANARFNRFDLSLADRIEVPDLYRPIKNILSLKIRTEIKETIKQAVKHADKIIIRSLGNIYTDSALMFAKKYNKPYLVEVTGFAWEGMWYHSFRGKLVAFFKENRCKQLILNAPNVVYVTKQELQKRYPTLGNSIGCSDVELGEIESNILDKRIKKIESNKSEKLVIGTSGFLDVKYKGQASVIKALAFLKEFGIKDIKYKLIGAGSGNQLISLANKLGIADQVQVEGMLPHEYVAAWYDSLDAYIHPGYIEGLCRSIVEAMSRALPVTCSSVGGNIELANKDMFFSKGNIKDIANVILKLRDKSILKKQAEYSFNKAKEFDKKLLDKERDFFYLKFTKQ